MFGICVRIECYSKDFIGFFDYLETALWLRRVGYDRLPMGRTLGVFVLSAFWVRKPTIQFPSDELTQNSSFEILLR